MATKKDKHVPLFEIEYNIDLAYSSKYNGETCSTSVLIRMKFIGTLMSLYVIYGY